MPLKPANLEDERDEPGLQDASVSDFLLPYLLGKVPMGQAAEAATPAAPAAEDAAGTQMRELLKQSMSKPAMPHMEEGGLVGDFDVDGGDSDTVKGLPLNPAAIPPQTAAADAVSPTAAPKPAVLTAPTALTAKAANPRPLPGMPADVTPDQLQAYLNQQRGAINKYSPDAQYAQEIANVKSRTGLGGIPHAGATFADAIMQGVANRGPGQFAKNMEERANSLADREAGAMERARKGSMENVEANQKIDMQDAASPLSKAYQQAFGPIFSKMGYDPKSVMSMPASQINTVADLGVRYADAQTQLELKKAMLQVQTMQAQAQMENMKAERQEKEKEITKGAAEDVLKGSKIPFFGPSHAEKQAASQKLAELSQGTTQYAPDVLNYAKAHGITPDQAQAIKNKRTGAQ